MFCRRPICTTQRLQLAQRGCSTSTTTTVGGRPLSLNQFCNPSSVCALGTLLQTGVPTVIGSHMAWWNVYSDCRFRAIHNVWTCPKTPEREIGCQSQIKHPIAVLNLARAADIEMIIPGITGSKAEQRTYESHRHIGYFAPLEAGHGDYSRALPLSKNPGSTGLINRVWRLDLVAGAPKYLDFNFLQVST